MRSARLSLYSFITCALLLAYVTFIFYPKWQQKRSESVFGWDAFSYYLYLPATFIYKDLKQQKFADSIISKYGFLPDFKPYRSANGNCVITYSSGMAVVYLPFFAIAHLAAKPLGYPADGFSVPYQFAIQTGSLLIALIGIWYLRKLLLLYYGDKVTAITLLILVIGTNYLNFATFGATLTHNWLFTIYVFLLLNTYYFYKTPRFLYAARIGFLTGLAILIRPTEIVIVLIPLLWGIERFSSGSFRERSVFLKQHAGKLMLALACGVAIASVQIVYWLYVAGQPFVYSYDDKGFSWLAPHLYGFLASYESGWLLYTPVMLFAFIGLIPFFKKGPNRIAILTIMVVSIYVASAWDIWWYGSGSGRAMVQYYVVLLFPLAAFIEWMLQQKILKWIISLPLLLFIYLNIWCIFVGHAGEGLMDAGGGMTNAYYRAVVGRWHVPAQKQKLKDTNELYEGIFKPRQLLYTNDFEQEADSLYDQSAPVIEGKHSLYIKALSISPEFSFALTDRNAQWLRVQSTFHCLNKQWDGWKMMQLVARFTYRGNIVKERLVKIERFINNGETKELYLDIKLPQEQTDSISIIYWNGRNDQNIIADNLKVWSFNEQ